MTAPTAPQISCYITLPNQTVATDYGPYLAYTGGRGSVSVTQNFGRQGDTATLNLIDPNYSSGAPPALSVHPTFVFPTFSQVKLFDNAAYAYYISIGKSVNDANDAATLFSGYIQDPTLHINSPTEAEWALSCVDYGGYANASIAQATYEGILMGNAVVDLVKKANCGIKAALIAQGGYVQPGPIIPRTIIHYTNLTSGLQKISKMASGQSAYGWYIDGNLNLHFYDQQQAPSSGITVTDQPSSTYYSTPNAAFTEVHMDQSQGLQYDFDGTTLYNRALVVGASKVISTAVSKKPTNSWTSPGGKSQWQLTHVPDISARIAAAKTSTATELPVVHVNGVQQSVTIYDGSSKVTTQWTIDQHADGSWWLQVTPGYGKVPGAGSTISIWYRYRTTITAQADLKLSQKAIGGPNKGIFATVVNQTSISTTTAAYQRATRELAEYGHPQEKITFTTTAEFLGTWRAGDTFMLNSILLLDSQRNFAPGINAKFMITQQSMHVIEGGFRQWQVTAVRVQ